jgi:formylglycine-generating enzyme required for sulfatase activity
MLAAYLPLVLLGAAPEVGSPSALVEVEERCAFLPVIEEYKWVHMVCLSAYAIDRTEVTVEAYQRCVDAGKCRTACSGRDSPPDCSPSCNAFVPGKERHPVNCVNYKDAETYCRWNGQRLPTRAEWERAAEIVPPEAGTAHCPIHQEYPEELERTPRPETPWQSHPVCSDPCSNMGPAICDMAGNLAEWVSDWYWEIGEYNSKRWFRGKVDKQGQLHDPTPPPCRGRHCDLHGFRSTCSGRRWVGSPLYLDCDRQLAHPWYAIRFIGFRCVTDRTPAHPSRTGGDRSSSKGRASQAPTRSGARQR